nr:bifunctional aminoglycoside phosphotransferase/ATP-binding protein [Halorhodospira halochloris]
MLAGEYVLKLKKPVNLGFLDFSTLERRGHFCAEEIRLNSRLAPQIYLRRVEITGDVDEPVIEGDGEVLEYAVLMRRFPENELMNRLLREGRLPDNAIIDLAETVAQFHRSIPQVETDSDYGQPERVAEPVMQNFQQLSGQSAAESVRAELHALRRWSEAELRRLEPVMRERREAGMIRECHGDLHLGNVAWHDEQVIVFDGIEFDPALRWIDTVSEIAFTVMDLEFQGVKRLRNIFLDAYLQRTGDYQALKLLPFYAVYRALVRAKINGFEVEQGAGCGAQEALEEHVQLARSFTRTRNPELVITFGLSGSGKSRRARRLVEERGFIRLRSDVERKRLFGMDPLDSSESGLDEGLYTQDASDMTYQYLLDQARTALRAGFSVAVDAAFLAAKRRKPFLDLAEELGCRFRILHVSAREEVLRERLRQRMAKGKDPSEAGEAVLDAQLKSAEPPTGEEAPFVEMIDTEERFQ